MASSTDFHCFLIAVTAGVSDSRWRLAVASGTNTEAAGFLRTIEFAAAAGAKPGQLTNALHDNQMHGMTIHCIAQQLVHMC